MTTTIALDPVASPARPSREVAEVERDVMRLLFGKFILARLLIAPFPISLVLFVAWGEPALWRKLVLFGCFAAMLIWTVVERYRFVRSTTSGLPAWPTLLLLAFFQVTVTLATGGIESPILPSMVPVGLIFALFGGPRVGRALLLLQIVFLCGLTWAHVHSSVPDLIPQFFGGGARAGHSDAHVITSALVVGIMTAAVTNVGLLVRATVIDIFRREVRARDELLKAHADQAHLMTSLSGEIAHELKNPLASVKGLAALVAKDVEGKAGERVTVLRREVDRMQEILDEFLNFSRPLVPLSQERVDLTAVSESVAALHEGQAQQRGVHVVVSQVSPAEVRCDPRKVRQVLINLVQNALEVAPPGTEVELVVRRDPDGWGRVEVRDRGPGLPESLGERVFEPGVTTKVQGSGLGLTIARGLARQHGGELTLRARESGGCVAELALPEGGRP